MRYIVRDLTFTEENPTLRHCLLSSPVKLVPRPLLPALRHQGRRFLPALLRRQFRRLFSIVLGHRTSHFQVPIYRNQSRMGRERRRRRWEMIGRGREWRLEMARNWSENCSRLSAKLACAGRKKRGLENRRHLHVRLCSLPQEAITTWISSLQPSATEI